MPVDLSAKDRPQRHMDDWLAASRAALFQLSSSVAPEQRALVIRNLDEASAIGPDYVVLIGLSCVIATYGLVINSAAVIIGAMLVAPLMSPILMIALAGVRRDLRQLIRGIRAVTIGVILALGLSVLLSHEVLTGGLNLLEQLPSELLSRTHPTQFDLMIALAGGATAAYALSRPKLSATLPGVAIATALMPPLCAAEIGVALGRGDVASGAFFLFVGNFVAIVTAAAVVFSTFGFRPPYGVDPWSRQSLPAMAASMLLLFVLTVPLFGYLGLVSEDLQEDIDIRDAFENRLATIQDASLVGFDKRKFGDQITITATVRTPRDLTDSEALGIQRDIAAPLGGHRVILKLLIEPLVLLDPDRSPSATHDP